MVGRLRLSLPSIPGFKSQVCCLKTCVHWDMVGTCYPCLRLTAQPWMFDDVCTSFAHGFRRISTFSGPAHLSTYEIWEANPYKRSWSVSALIIQFVSLREHPPVQGHTNLPLFLARNYKHAYWLFKHKFNPTKEGTRHANCGRKWLIMTGIKTTRSWQSCWLDLPVGK